MKPLREVFMVFWVMSSCVSPTLTSVAAASRLGKSAPAVESTISEQGGRSKLALDPEPKLISWESGQKTCEFWYLIGVIRVRCIICYRRNNILLILFLKML